MSTKRKKSNQFQYLRFKTAYIPYDGRDTVSGIPGDETFPQRFITQTIYPFKK